MDRETWTAAVAHHLHRHWRTLTAEALEDTAGALWSDEHLREMPPAEAAAQWLRPIERGMPIHVR